MRSWRRQSHSETCCKARSNALARLIRLPGQAPSGCAQTPAHDPRPAPARSPAPPRARPRDPRPPPAPHASCPLHQTGGPCGGAAPRAPPARAHGLSRWARREARSRQSGLPAAEVRRTAQIHHVRAALARRQRALLENRVRSQGQGRPGRAGLAGGPHPQRARREAALPGLAGPVVRPGAFGWPAGQCAREEGRAVRGGEV
jgi:hypothetical protein